MVSFGSRFAPWVEFFTLERARRVVLAYAPGQAEQVAAAYAAGVRRERAADGIEDSLVACGVFRDALLAYRHALAVAGGPHADAPALTGVVAPGDPLSPDPAGDLERVRRALASNDPFYFDSLDSLDRDELELTRGALSRAAPRLRAHVEPRSLVNLQATRIGRAAGIAILLAFLALRTAQHVLWPDLAAGKPVTAGSLQPGSPDGHDLVGGDIGTSFAIATTPREPWVQVDLEAAYKLTRVEVYNRVDGWFDDSIPLALETSLDGQSWDDVARLDKTFGRSPWVTRLPRKPARYVRVRGSTAGVTLAKVRIYGAR